MYVNPNLIEVDFDNLTDWTKSEPSGSVFEIDPAGQLHLDCTSVSAYIYVFGSKDFGSIGTGDYYAEIKFKGDTWNGFGAYILYGMQNIIEGNTNRLRTYIGNDFVSPSGSGIIMYDGTSYNLVYSKTWDNDWHTIVYYIHNSQTDCDIWVDKDPETEAADVTDADCSDIKITDGKIEIGGYGSSPGPGEYHIDYIYVGDALHPTLTVYPDAGSGNTTVDGRAGVNSDDETFATLRGVAGMNSDDTSASTTGFEIKGSSTSGQYANLFRNIWTFDTSALGTGATIISATLSIWVIDSTTYNVLLGEDSANSAMVIVASTPANNNALVNADYGQLGSTEFGRSDKQSDLSEGAYNSIILNANGRAAVSTTGITKLGGVFGWDFGNTTTGLTWKSNSYQAISTAFSDTAGTDNDPKLVIRYIAGEDTANAIFLGSNF